MSKRGQSLPLVFLLLVSSAQATTFVGPILQLQSNASQTTAGNTRVSINTGNVTACSGAYAGWYSYDLPSASTAGLWGAQLLAAITTNKSVRIYGTGSCDAYGLETVLAIVTLP